MFLLKACFIYCPCLDIICITNQLEIRAEKKLHCIHIIYDRICDHVGGSLEPCYRQQT